MPYCLEILRFIEDLEEKRAHGGAYTHVGYEHSENPSTGHREVKLFRTKKKAAEYYDRTKRVMGFDYPPNFKMRCLNAHGTWLSDWHPKTKFAYHVREYIGVGVPLQPDEEDSVSVMSSQVSDAVSQVVA